MDPKLTREIQESLFVHRPLPLHPENSLEAGFAKKAVRKAGCWIWTKRKAISRWDF